jgi:hypothetical protein
MSAIPPSGIVSVLGTSGAQRHQTHVDDAARNERAEASRQLAGQGDVILEVEGTDADTQVHAESEGSGASGRQGRDDESPPADEATHEDDDGGAQAGRLDITA